MPLHSPLRVKHQQTHKTTTHFLIKLTFLSDWHILIIVNINFHLDFIHGKISFAGFILGENCTSNHISVDCMKCNSTTYYTLLKSSNLCLPYFDNLLIIVHIRVQTKAKAAPVVVASETPTTDLGGPVDAVRSDITVESKKIGIIIGPKGATLHGIQGTQRAHFMIMLTCTLLLYSLIGQLNFFLHAFISYLLHSLSPYCHHYYQPFFSVSFSPFIPRPSLLSSSLYQLFFFQYLYFSPALLAYLLLPFSSTIFHKMLPAWKSRPLKGNATLPTLLLSSQ